MGIAMIGNVIAAILLFLFLTPAIAQDSRAVCFSDSSPGAVIPACDDLIETDPRHAQAHQARGIAWYKVGDYERAIADYSASLAIDPKYVRAYYNRGLAWEAEGKLRNALNDLRTFQTLDPQFPDTQEAIARITGLLKSRTASSSSRSAAPSSRAGEEIVRMEQMGGVSVVPVRFNEVITLNAIVDSGASDVSVPADIVRTLIRTNTISDSDFLGEKTYTLAAGSKMPSRQFRIRAMRVGNKIIENVIANVASVNADILLGQSFLSRFRSWSVDNEKHTLVLR